jgi:nitroreductase
MMSVTLDNFLDFVRARRSARHFQPGEIPAELLRQLLEAARWAPSGFNLQPAHFVIVTEQTLKDKLYAACMKQSQVREANAVVVFTGDKRVAAHNMEPFLQLDREAQAIDADYEKMLRRNIPLSFSTGPLGLGWLGKFLAESILGRIIPIPKFPGVHINYWLGKQVGIAAMNFMLAAHAAGLSTCPMEGFSERAVRRVLKIPASHAVILVIPVGYAARTNATKTRLPLDGQLHWNGW